MKHIAAPIATFIAILGVATGARAESLTDSVDLDIASQPIETALLEFSKQTGLQLVVPIGSLPTHTTPAVTGNMPLQAALNLLLSDTKLTYKLVGNRTLTIVPPRDPVSTRDGSAIEVPLNEKGEETQVRLVRAEGEQSKSETSVQQAGDSGKQPIQEIIVTAQKRKERLIDVPQSVSSLSADALAEQGITQFRDFANAIPGLNFSTAGAGYSQLSIRGVTAGVDVGQTVGIYVDDVPYGSSSVFGAASQHTLDVGLFDVDRIEVLRGPQGTLYGASALGGVIKYVTKTPSLDRFEGEARGGVSSTRSGGVNYDGSLAVNAPIAENRAALRASTFYSRDGGYVDNVTLNDEDANAAEVYGGRLDLLFQVSERLDLRLTGFLQEIHRDGEGTVDYQFSGASLTGELDQQRVFHEPFDQRFRLISAALTYDLDWAEATSVSSYQTTDMGYIQDISPLYVPLFGGFYSGIAADTTAAVDKFAQEVRFASQDERVLDWQAGVFFTDERSYFDQPLLLLDENGLPTPNTLLGNTVRSTFEEVAAFGTVTWHITDKTDVSGGLRYARNDQTFRQDGSGLFGLSAPRIDSDEDVFTYLANVRHRFSDRSMGYARVATGYRPGGPNVVTGAVGVLPTFDSDGLTSYEAGFKAETQDRALAVDVALYFIDWDDMHVSIGNNGFSAFGNARGGAKVRGGELSVTARPVTALALAGTFAYQNGEINEAEPSLGASAGERLPNVPRITAGVSADYTFAGRLQPTVGASARFVDERTASFNASPLYAQYRLPDYTAVDVRAGLSLANVDLRLYVRNLFDEQGQLSAFNWRGTAMPSISQPRTIGISLTTHF